MEHKSPKEKVQFWIEPTKCMGCGMCLRCCPTSAIDAAFIIDSSLCIGCGLCDRNCWFGAISRRTDGFVSEYHVHHPHTEQ